MNSLVHLLAEGGEVSREKTNKQYEQVRHADESHHCRSIPAQSWLTLRIFHDDSIQAFKWACNNPKAKILLILLIGGILILVVTWPGLLYMPPLWLIGFTSEGVAAGKYLLGCLSDDESANNLYYESLSLTPF